MSLRLSLERREDTPLRYIRLTTSKEKFRAPARVTSINRIQLSSKLPPVEEEPVLSEEPSFTKEFTPKGKTLPELPPKLPPKPSRKLVARRIDDADLGAPKPEIVFFVVFCILVLIGCAIDVGARLL
jgi:hypothetical protein